MTRSRWLLCLVFTLTTTAAPAQFPWPGGRPQPPGLPMPGPGPHFDPMVPGAGIARDGLPGCHFPLDSAFPAAGQGFERPPLFGRSPVPGELIGPVPGVGRPRMPGVPGGPWPGSQPPTEGARYGQPRLVARPTPTLPPDPAQVLIPQAIPADVVLAAPEHHYPAFNVNRTNGLEPWLRFLPVLILGGAGAIGSAFRKPPDRSRGAP